MALTTIAPSLRSQTMDGSADRKRQLHNNLRCSVGDGAAFGAMVGLGETYLPAFVLAIGLGELAAGMIGSLPLLIGGILQLISPMMIRRLGSHKRWVVSCAVIQAAMFVPLIAAALIGTASLWSVLVVASIYWGASLATGPAWNTWIGTLVPAPVRPRYFAARTRISQACVFGGFLFAGVSLQWADDPQTLLMIFAGLFALAGIFRIISACMLAGQSEPIPIPPGMSGKPFRHQLRDLTKGNSGQLLLFLVSIQAAVQISGPYFTPFMLNNLNHSYGEYVTLIAIAFLARIFMLPIWGKFARRFGAMRLLYLGAIGLTPMSASWVISQNFYWLLAMQLISGAVWAAYELAFFLLFFESIPQQERTGVLTVYNLINTAAWVFGSLIGGVLLFLLETTYSAYLVIFVISGLARLLSLGLLVRLPRFNVEADQMGVRTISVRPNGANLDAPVLPSLPDQIPDEFQAQAS